MEEKIPSLESEALCTLQEMQGANAEMLASNKVWLQTGIFYRCPNTWSFDHAPMSRFCRLRDQFASLGVF